MDRLRAAWAFDARWQVIVFYDPDESEMEGYALEVLHDREANPAELSDFQVEYRRENVLPATASSFEVSEYAHKCLYYVIQGQLISDPNGIECDFSEGR